MTQLTNYSRVIGTTPVLVYNQLGAAQYMRIWNVSASGGPTIWLTRQGTVPAANTAGSYSLAPGEYEEFPSGGVLPPLNSLWAVATSAGAALTVEVG